MPGREYACSECSHQFRAPEGTPRDKRSLMCPACGSVDLKIVGLDRPAAKIVMRAKDPARAGLRRNTSQMS